MKWIIEMPEGWKPENKIRQAGEPASCTFCPFCEALAQESKSYDDYFCYPGNCPLGKAEEYKEKK